MGLGFGGSSMPGGLMGLNPQQLQGISQALMGFGQGLAGGQGWGQGVAMGLGGANQGLQQAQAYATAAEERKAKQKLLDLETQKYQSDMDRQTAYDNAAAKLPRPIGVDDVTWGNLPAEERVKLSAGIVSNSLTPKEPYSTSGKLDADLAAGKITQAEHDAALKKENYIAYPQPQQPSEIQTRLRLATDAWNAENPDKPGRPTLKFLQDYGVAPSPKSGGMTVYGPDGQPIVEFGKEGGMGKQTANTYEEGLLNAGKSLQRMTYVQQSFKPEYQTYGTKMGMAWDELKTKFDPNALNPQDKQGLEDFAKYRQFSYDNLNRGIKELTGVAMNQTEGQRLLLGIPNPGTGIFDGDGPVTFKSKMDATIKESQDAIMRANYANAHGLNPLSSGIELADVPALLNRRGDEIAAEVKKTNPGISPDALAQEVNAQLDKEFGR